MKVVFLDIDGVLNSTRTCVARGGYPHDLSDKHKPRFDWMAVTLIRRACLAAGARVVISSTWRMQFHHQQLGDFFGLPTIDSTPVLGGKRGLEIDDWLTRHPDVEEYAIVDDDSDMLGKQLPHFVHTNGLEGYNWASHLRLCEVLGVNAHDGREALAWEAA